MNDQRKGMKKCPEEIKRQIYHLAGPLTKYLNGRMELSPDSSDRLIRRDAIQIEWRGDYSELFSCTDNDDFHKAVADIVINRSKEFHIWLVEHLRSNKRLRKLYDLFQRLNWRDWWKDSISSSSQDDLGKHFEAAIEYCHVELVQCIMTNEKLRLRVSGGDYSYFLEHFITQSQYYASDTDYVFRKSANSKMLWTILHNVTLNGSNRAMDAAVKICDIEIVKWVHQNISDCCTTDAIDNGAMNGHLEVVKWLHENRTEGCTTDVINGALNGHIEIVKFLHENRTEGCTTDVINGAAANGHLEIVKFLHENRTEGCTTDAMDNAAYNGHLEVVKFLHENRTEGCTIWAMDYAAYNGHLDVVKWLHENRTEGCSKYAMDWAAGQGHLHVVKWLHDNRAEGCTTNAMDDAALYGRLEVLQWLHENRTEGCTSNAKDFAANRGHMEVVEWLKQHYQQEV